jgi:hypothetical protein
MRAFIGRLAHPEPGFDVNHAAQSSGTDKAFFVPPTKVPFGPFRLLPTQFLLLEGDEPVSTFFASDEHVRLRIAAVCAIKPSVSSCVTAMAWGWPWFDADKFNKKENRMQQEEDEPTETCVSSPYRSSPTRTGDPDV